MIDFITVVEIINELIYYSHSFHRCYHLTMTGSSTFVWPMLSFLRILSSDLNVWLMISYAFSIASPISFAGDPWEPFDKLTSFQKHTLRKCIDTKKNKYRTWSQMSSHMFSSYTVHIYIYIVCQL